MIKILPHEEVRLEHIKAKSTKNLTEEDLHFLKQKGVINGCWGCGSKCSQKLAKFFSGFFFEASCEIHDFGYWKWWDDQRRLECDRKFFSAMCRDIERQPVILYPYFYLVAVGFYLAVRIGGRKYFYYSNKK